MNPLMIAQIALGGFQAISTISAARAQAVTEEQQARQMEIDRVIAEAEAIQKQNARMDAYIAATNVNEAMFSFSEGETAIVENAFYAAEEKVVGKDISTAQTVSSLDSHSRTVGALIQKEKAKNTLMAGYFNAIDAFASGYIRAKSI